MHEKQKQKTKHPTESLHGINYISDSKISKWSCCKFINIYKCMTHKSRKKHHMESLRGVSYTSDINISKWNCCKNIFVRKYFQKLFNVASPFHLPTGDEKNKLTKTAVLLRHCEINHC